MTLRLPLLAYPNRPALAESRRLGFTDLQFVVVGRQVQDTGPRTSRETRALAFVIGRERLTIGGRGALDVSGAALGPFGINGAKETAAPAPSSNHSGSVNAIFADGHGQSLAETMEPLVYVQLLTSGGAYNGEAPVSNDDYGY